MTTAHATTTASHTSASGYVSQPVPGYVPQPPTSLAAAGVSQHLVESIVLKLLAAEGSLSGRAIADHVALPFGVLEPVLHSLKYERHVVFKATALAGDYVYELSAGGLERAAVHNEHNTYCGAAPVPLDDYLASVNAQSVRKQTPKLADVRSALDELTLDAEVLAQLGEAMNSGLGLFLFGAPGNGKTSIAERLIAAYEPGLWIPKAIFACGEILRLFDPVHHELLEVGVEHGDYDHRWVKIRRPTILVGGELTLEHLEVTVNPATGVIEAPLQLKSNGGALVIDDFGRQRVTPTELLNRWVLPLERRVDHLTLPNGRKFQAPFDQLLVFSTNLQPEHLVDEAFLRRIPYKICVQNPTKAEFRQVFIKTAQSLGIECSETLVDYLVNQHYAEAGREPRFCHARDLLQHIHTACRFRELPMAVTHERVDAAVKNYFAAA